MDSPVVTITPDPLPAQASPVTITPDAPPARPATPLQPYDPAKFGRFTTEANYPQWATTPPAIGPFAKPGEYEAWTGAHGSKMDTLKDVARAPAMAAATVAPMLTGGASLPVQAAVMGASGAAQSKLEGGSNTEAAISGGIGALLPFAGEAVQRIASHPDVVRVVHRIIPSLLKEDAAQLFSTVAKDANQVPVSLDNSEDAALKLMDWQKKTQLGPTLNKFLNRITAGNKGPLTYEEARDFHQLLSKMSVDENLRLAPPVKFQVQRLAAGLKTDVGNAAETVGQGANYYKAMGDYATASKWQEFYDAAKQEAVKALKYGIPAGVAGYAAKRTIDAATGQ